MIVEFEDYPLSLQPVTVDALHYFADSLMSQRLKKSLVVCVEGHKGIIDGYANALCSWEDDWTRPKEFKITINHDQEENDLLTTLAHEMVHVKQWARGEMKERFYPQKVIKWNNQLVDRESTEYWDLPWEIEAYGRQEGLVVRYLIEKDAEHKEARKHPFNLLMSPVPVFGAVG